MSEMSVAGSWDCTIDTPMGAKRGLLIVTPDGEDRFTGSVSGELGDMPITDGRISGAMLQWQMQLTMPMALTLDCTAMVEGDAISGQVAAGMFGTMRLKGVRAG